MKNENALHKIKFYISESKNFRNDGYVQLHYKNLLKEALLSISGSEIFTDEELSDIFQKKIESPKEELLKFK